MQDLLSLSPTDVLLYTKNTNFANGIYTDSHYYWTRRNHVLKMFDFDAMIEDLDNDGITVTDLMDIRENNSYIAFVALIGGYINYDEDGY